MRIGPQTKGQSMCANCSASERMGNIGITPFLWQDLGASAWDYDLLIPVPGRFCTHGAKPSFETNRCTYDTRNETDTSLVRSRWMLIKQALLLCDRGDRRAIFHDNQASLRRHQRERRGSSSTKRWANETVYRSSPQHRQPHHTAVRVCMLFHVCVSSHLSSQRHQNV